MTSKPSSARSARLCAWSNKVRAAWIDGSPTHSTARAATAGSSRNVAAVTMPRMPSEPIISCLRSKPRLSFFNGTSWLSHRAIGQHRLQPQHLRTHRTMAQHLRAAGIGRDQPADRGRALAAERQRKPQPLARHRLVQRLKDDTRAACDLARGGVDRPDRIHPAHVDQQFVPARIGRGATAHSAVSALGHDRHAVFAA